MVENEPKRGSYIIVRIAQAGLFASLPFLCVACVRAEEPDYTVWGASPLRDGGVYERFIR